MPHETKLHKYLILIIPVCCYLLTLAPTIIGGDSAAACIRVYDLQLNFGSASDHPLHILLGKLFSLLPFELAFNLNLMSAFFGVLTVLIIFSTIHHLTQSSAAALFGALSLTVSHAFWLHSVIAEVYVLNTFFLSLLVYLTLTQLKHRWFKYVFPMVFILGVLNHLILAITLPAFLVYIYMNADSKFKRILLITSGSLFSMLMALLLWLIVYNKAFVLSIIKGPPSIKDYLLPPDLYILMKEMVFYGLYLCYQYPMLGFLIGGIGIYQGFKKEKSTALFLLLIIILNGGFFLKTTAWQSYGGTKYTFYISDYTIFSVFMGYGFYTLTHKMGKMLPTALTVASVSMTIIFYSLMPTIVTSLNIDLVHARTLAYRNNNRFFLNPNKSGYVGDRKLGEEILGTGKKNATVFADFTIYTILNYLIKIENRRPDIRIIPCKENVNIQQRVAKIKGENPATPVYIADNNSYYNLTGIEKRYVVKRQGPFYEIVLK